MESFNERVKKLSDSALKSLFNRVCEIRDKANYVYMIIKEEIDRREELEEQRKQAVARQVAMAIKLAEKEQAMRKANPMYITDRQGTVIPTQGGFQGGSHFQGQVDDIVKKELTNRNKTSA